MRKKLKKASEKEHSSDVLLLLINLLESVTESSCFDELLEKVGHASQKLMQVQASSLMLLDEAGKTLTIVMPTGPVRDEIKGKKMPADKGFAGWVVKHKKPIIANNVQQDDDIFYGDVSEAFVTYNLICVPLFNDDGEMMGVLQALNPDKKDRFEETDIPLFQTLANHSARALERLRSKHKLAELYEKQDIFFREIHHRVKNDFAFISGIVQLESFDVKDHDAQKVLFSVQSRIETMAAVYELLTNKTEDSEIEISGYLKKLISKIATSFSNAKRDINIAVEINDVYLQSHIALSCGLILNELLMNSYKHAFDYTEDGDINIQLTQKNKSIKLLYADNGKGFADDLEISDLDSLGFELVKTLVKKIHGSLHINGDNGATFTIQFEVED